MDILKQNIEENKRLAMEMAAIVREIQKLQAGIDNK
jgi:hypothetical protein